MKNKIKPEGPRLNTIYHLPHILCDAVMSLKNVNSYTICPCKINGETRKG